MSAPQEHIRETLDKLVFLKDLEQAVGTRAYYRSLRQRIDCITATRRAKLQRFRRAAKHGVD